MQVSGNQTESILYPRLSNIVVGLLTITLLTIVAYAFGFILSYHFSLTETEDAIAQTSVQEQAQTFRLHSSSSAFSAPSLPIAIDMSSQRAEVTASVLIHLYHAPL